MSMKKMNQMLAMYMAAATMANGLDTPPLYGERTISSKKPKPPQEVIPNGLKAFTYGEETIYALNQKNADKKAKKKGLI